MPTQKRESVSFLMLFMFRNLLILILLWRFRICQNENGEIPERYWLLKESQKGQKINHLDLYIPIVGKF